MYNTCNVPLRSVLVTIIAVETQKCIFCVLVKLHVTVNCIKLLSVAQQWCMANLCRRKQWTVRSSSCAVPGAAPKQNNFRLLTAFCRRDEQSGWTDRKIGQKIGVYLPLLTCFPSAWPFRLLYRRGRKSRRDLWIVLCKSLRSFLLLVKFCHAML